MIRNFNRQNYFSGNQENRSSVKPESIYWQVIDLFFPPFCCHCGKLGFEVCPECLNRIERIDQTQFCEKCGHTVHPGKKCLEGGVFFNNIRSWAYYSDTLKSMIRYLKYHRGTGIIKYLVPEIVNFINQWFDHIDVIVPLPLGKQREHIRGYNQTALFAKPAARALRIDYLPKAVVRTRETISQVGLSAEERKSNIKDAFFANSELIKGLNILLMDDITTTGSTINECAKALANAGAANVFCFTLAKAVNKNLELEEKWIKN